MNNEALLPGRLSPSPRSSIRTMLRRRGIAAAESRGSPWQTRSLVALLALTAFLYLWGLGASGWANSFYSAAVQAGATSWKAFLFGSFDSANFITVDKPPASMWIMELSARIFGVNAWSILVPQALEGVAAVAVVYATVRRGFGAAAGLIAGSVLALTPVAALMFRFNNPDALLTLLLAGSAYAVLRSLESARTRWLLLAGALVGFGFLTKMLQAFLVLPAYVGVYLLAAPVGLRRRVLQVLAAGAAVALSAGWWVALVALWPAADRPYIGGSQDNSVISLIFGYNGFGRITGAETGSVGGNGAAASMWGPTGITRLFNADFGGQISWLLPAALISGGALLWLRGRAPRTDPRRAATLLWGGWLVVTGLILSFAQGIIHPYYTVVLAPAIGALVGMGAVTLWQHRNRPAARVVMAVGVVATAGWAYMLLDRSPAWLPWLRSAVLAFGIAAAILLVAVPRPRRALLIATAVAASGATLAGPTAYAIDTAATAHTGAIVSAGPAVAGTRGGPGGISPGGGGFPGRAGGPPPPGFAAGAARGFGGAPPGNGLPPNRAGGLLDTATPPAALVTALRQNGNSYTWVAATVGANTAAGYQLAAGAPVLAIGGFNGTDPSPTLAEFQSLVAAGRVHYFIPGLGGSGAGGNPGAAGSGTSASTAAQITTWVQGTFPATTVGGATIYDLSSGAVSSPAP